MKYIYLKGLENLVVGEIYTYPQLCQLFNEEQEGGNSKKSQLKRWECFFRWTNPTTQKYRIEEIYPEPLSIIDNRKNNGGNNTGKYTALDDLIMAFVDEVGEVKTTLPKLAEEVGILSGSYNKYRLDYSEFCKNNEYSTEFATEYFDNVYLCVIRAIERSIKRIHDDGFIISNSYYVLVLKNNSKEIIPIDVMSALEAEIEGATGIKRYYLKTPQQRNDFKSKVISLIEQTMGLAVSYYYKEYRLCKTILEYEAKEKCDKWRLTRKFLITICYNMIRSIYKQANQVYIDDPKTGTSHLVSEDYDSSEISKLIKDVIDLSNYFFVYMNKSSWDAYWDENELGENKKYNVLMAAILFETFNKQSTKDIYHENRTAEDKHNRVHAIEELGIEEVEDVERILPDVDWRKVCSDEDYALRYANARNKYYEWINMMVYSKDKFIDEYGLYIADLVAHDRQDEQMHYFLFVHQLDETDTRYLSLL